MLLINGAIAVLNGMLVTTCRILCCLRGGIFCDGVCRCDPNEGECCGDEWYTEPGECCDDEWIDENGEVEGREGEWICCNDSNGTVTFRILAPAGPGCEGLDDRCCTDGNCTQVPAEECAGEVLSGSCARFGCPKSCCEENADGLVTCETIDELLCTGTVDEGPCETACKGACCIDGELAEGSPLTQQECDDLGGCFLGVGSASCEEQSLCRAPFETNEETSECCERVISSAARLKFQGPRKRACPEFDGCGYRVTVTVKTGSPVYVHGGLFGSPYEACTAIISLFLCNDELHVTPAPCSGNLQNLDIEVCWGDPVFGPEGLPGETLRLQCCQDITYLLGDCCGCVTTLLYEGEGCTSNAAFVMNGDAIVEVAANPSANGPLVLTGNFTQGGSCERTLTLTGNSTQPNELTGSIQNASGGTNVEKTGSGVWRLSGASSYTGQLAVRRGTLIVASAVGSGSSPFGQSNLDPSVGGADGPVFLFAEGVNVNRGFTVTAGAPLIVLGGTGANFSSFAGAIRLGRGVTLQASTGGTVQFDADWQDESGGSSPAVAITIGSEGNAGVVILGSALPASITQVDIVRGTARLSDLDNDRINSATPVTIGSAGGPATLDINGQSQSLSSLTFVGNGSVVTNGTLRLVDSPVVTVQGTGHFIDSLVTLDATATIDVSASFLISGDISGSGGLIKDGIGTLTLTGTNTYTGTTTVQAGVLQIGNGGTAGTLGSGNVVNDAIVVFNRSDNLTVSNVISGSGSVVKLGGGELTLSGANTYSGGTTVSAGILIGTTASLQGDIVVAAATALIFDDPSGGTYAGIISGTGTVEKTGAGTVVFTGSNSYTGATTISTGTLQVGNGGAAGTLGTGAVNNNGALAFNRNNAITVASAISGTGSLAQNGSGTLTLEGTLSYSGTTDIAAGTLVVTTLVSGPPNVSSSTFTPTTLVVEFTATPSSGETYRLLPGATAQTYASVTLNGAGGATGTYNSANSTLTID
jgi:autotransporter-associated beta strand protein